MHSMCSTVLQRLSSSFQDTTYEKTLLIFETTVYQRENKLVNPQYLKFQRCNRIYDCSFILAQHYLELSKGPNSSSAAFFCNQGFILLAAEFFSKMPLESGCYQITRIFLLHKLHSIETQPTNQPTNPHSKAEVQKQRADSLCHLLHILMLNVLGYCCDTSVRVLDSLRTSGEESQELDKQRLNSQHQQRTTSKKPKPLFSSSTH